MSLIIKSFNVKKHSKLHSLIN